MNSRARGRLAAIYKNTIGLIFDDGFVVGGAIIALVTTAVLSKLEAFRHGVLVGGILFVLVWVGLLISLVYAARTAAERDDA